MTSGKTDLAYAEIKKKILSGALPPLSDISEDALQKELEISRTPIREAVQRLQKEGFVYIYPRKGTIVSEVTPDLVHEIYQMRELNEPAIACEACKRIQRDWLLIRRNAFANPPEGLTEQELIQYFIEYDSELHMSLLDYCNNRFLRNIMTIVYDHSQRLRIKTSRPTHKEHDNATQEHIDIIDALLSQDQERVRNAVLEHIRSSRKISIGYYKFQEILETF